MPIPMPGDTTDLDPVEDLTVEAVDDEGETLFAVRGQGAGSEIALIVEPDQLAGLTTAASEVLQVLQDLHPRTLRRSEIEAASRALPAGEVAREVNVAHFFFSYEAGGERIAMLAVELAEEPVPDVSLLVRFWLSREQVASLVLQIERVLGMPPTRCPICGQPVGVNDHHCAREN